MLQGDVPPQYLYKILSPKGWEQTLASQKLCPTPMDASFIHLATKEQVDHVVKKFWKNHAYVLLKIDTEKIQGELRFERNPGGSARYYHLYHGTIALEAVVQATSSPKI